MNKNENIKLIHNAGDQIQFTYGDEFGFFANQLSDEQLIKFCRLINREALSLELGYCLILTKLTKEKNSIYVRNISKNLEFSIKLLDHSIYFSASDANWDKIDESFFYLVQNKWFKFLEEEVEDCQQHMFSHLA